METTIRLKPSELNDHMLNLVKMLVERSGYKEISISLSNENRAKRLRKETPSEVQKKITAALNDINTGNTSHFISFDADEFERLSQSLLKK